jgi:histidinol-phosphate phosphatase family protein
MKISEHFNIDQSWTLFLDRDGVINVLRVDDYVKNLDEFVFNEGAIAAISYLNTFFCRTIVVTNQQGVGKGLYSVKTLNEIHKYMIEEIANLSGIIDAVYFAPQLKDENSPMRKPDIGMALAAKEKFQEIDFAKSLMIGDSKSDMAFADNAGMKKILINHGQINPDFDGLQFENLLQVMESF